MQQAWGGAQWREENPPSRSALRIELSEAGDGYIMAECLDIPGCISQGKTHQEALANLMEAISVCLEVIAEDAAAKPLRLDSGSSKLSWATSELIPA